MSVASNIIIAAQDLERLRRLVDSSPAEAAGKLDAELGRAQVVPRERLPPDVVAMNSEVVYEDLGTGARRTVRVVYPQEADPARGHISVLAPLGSALLGVRVGQEVHWRVPRGSRRLRVVAAQR